MFKKVTIDTAFESVEVLRFPLILLVVFVHVIPPEVYAVRLGWASDRIYGLVSELISHQTGRIAVPCFFLFSGYFFFLKIHAFSARIYVQQLGKRWRSLLIPYVLWNVLFVLIVLLKNFIFRKLGIMEDDMYANIKQAHYYEILWAGPLLYPLWYLRDLICMVVLSPLFYILFRYTRGIGVLLLIVAYLMVWESTIPGLSTTAFFFFGAGAFMGMYNYDLMALGEGYKSLKFLIAALLLGIATYFNATPHYEYWMRPFILSGVIASLCIGKILAQTNVLKPHLLKLSSAVFFIYAAHSIYIINWLKGGFNKFILFHNGPGKLAAYFTIPIVAVLICYALYRLMNRFFPNILPILIGGRLNVKNIRKQI